MKLVCKFEDEQFKKDLISLLKSKSEEFGKFGSICKGILVEQHDDQGLYVPNNRDQTQVVVGEDFIKETLLDNIFKVPMNSFFQVHTGLAEMLYSKV
jgi:tRNA/tmRNA/rRNA uracil-C5-methylase (TrmA/RlmC/RlmD family)